MEVDICFDYPDKIKNLNPKVVIWNQGADISKDVSFIGMLKSDDEL